MKVLQYQDFFLNQKSLPPKDTPEFDALINEEIDRMMGGIWVGGVSFSGFLYWHLNHWYIRDDYEDEYGNIMRGKTLCSLRDNEWIVAEYLEQCRIDKKGYLHIGVRQFGKSELMASYIAYHATLFEHTQNVIVGGNDDDLQLLRDKIDFGIKNLWEGIRIPKLDKDTKKNMTRLGWKSRGGEDSVWSYLIVRNVAEGNKTEGPAGVTAKAYATDEIGKFSFAQSFEAAKPAFKSKYGWRCVPLLFGTGGSFDKGADAERFFWNPEANNLLAVIDPETGKKTAIFMSGIYRIDCKYQTTLADFLIRDKDSSLDLDELSKIPMWISDKEKARELILKERAEKAKDPDKVEYLKLIMYYPLTPEECFLSSAKNIFNTELAKKQQQKIRDTGGFGGVPVELYFDGDKIHHKISDKLPISSFPVKNNESKDAPIVMYEPPVPDPPFGLYVGGVDSYRDGSSTQSDSLGAVYIYKRIHNILTDKYEEMFVASYVARPADKNHWEEQARLLIKWYNAHTLVENDEISFIDYMKNKGDEYYLAPQPAFQKQLAPNSNTNRPYGLSRQSESVRNFLHSKFKQYMEEKILEERDEQGSVIKEIYGVSRIGDPLLLEEISKFNEFDNFDRIIAAELAIIMANSMDPIFGKTGGDKDPRLQSLQNRISKHRNNIFSTTPNRPSTSSRRNRLFQ